jgi:hypothetical protein
MVDVISLIIGFAFGVIVVGLALELGLKKSTRSNPASSHTKKWSISEISNPKIMAEYLSDVEIPGNSKLLVNKYKDKELLTGLNVKEHKGIRGNFIVGDDRALILAGPIKKDEVGFWTVEKDIIQTLNTEFERKWTEASKIHLEET